MAASLQAYNIQPSFVLFSDNGIGHPCHSYGYAFGWPALFSTKKLQLFPYFILEATPFCAAGSGSQRMRPWRRQCKSQRTRAAFERTARWAPGRCSKHKILTPSFVLFADNGIGNPRHSYGYTFGLPALFSTKTTATFPTFYACCNAVRNSRRERAPSSRNDGRSAAAARTGAPGGWPDVTG